nr:degenerin mec-4-like [Lytechinus pictus]
MAGVNGVRHEKYTEDGHGFQRHRRRSKSVGENSDQRELNAYFLISSAVQNTGAHGIPNIARANSMSKRIFWSILFMGAMAGFFWQTATLIDYYTDFEVIANLDEIYSGSMRYPAITFCNLNPYASSKASTFSREFADAVGVPYNDGVNVTASTVTMTSSTTSQSSTVPSTERVRCLH